MYIRLVLLIYTPRIDIDIILVLWDTLMQTSMYDGEYYSPEMYNAFEFENLTNNKLILYFLKRN